MKPAILAILLTGMACAQADELAKPQSGEPGIVRRVESAVERGVSAAASGVTRGARAAAHGIERAASATAGAVKATARKVEAATAPPESAASR